MRDIADTAVVQSGWHMKMTNKLNGVFRIFEYRQPRVHTHLPVWLQFHSPQNCLVPAVCVDISENGMGADMESVFEIGSRATLIVPSNSRPEPFILPVRIVSRHEQRYGFRFVPTGPEHIREIAAAVRAVADGSFPSAEATQLALEDERKAV